MASVRRIAQAPQHGTLAATGRVVLVGCCVLIMGCRLHDLLSVPVPPGIVNPGSLGTAQGADEVRAGAIAALNAVVGRGNGSYFQVSAILTDELADANNFGAFSATDRRVLPQANASDADLIYQGLQQARIQAEQAVAALRATPPPSVRAKTAQMFALQGYVEVLLGEGFCSGTTLGHLVPNGDIVHGVPLTSDSLYGVAEAAFDSALALAGDSAQIANLARVGLARTLVDRGQFPAAATAAQAVPEGFVYTVDYTAAAPNYWQAYYGGPPRYTVANEKGSNGLDYVSAVDPRLGTYVVGTAEDGSTQAVWPVKFDSAGAGPIVFASGLEAALIVAEAKLQAGNAAGWAAALNVLRADSGVAVLPDSSTVGASAIAQLNMMFRERAFWLYGTGHRLGDLRRLIRQRGRDQSAVFPSGAYPGPAGGSYGTDVNFPIPESERQNPNFHGCMNRNA